MVQKIILYDKMRNEIGNIALSDETKQLTMDLRENYHAEYISLLEDVLKNDSLILHHEECKFFDSDTEIKPFRRILVKDNIKSTDPKFLAALADKINRNRQSKNRLFAVLQNKQG